MKFKKQLRSKKMEQKFKRTQKSDILKYLKTHKKGLTQRQATDEFGCLRLSGVVCELRKEGYNIISEPLIVKTRYGTTSNCVTYKIK